MPHKSPFGPLPSSNSPIHLDLFAKIDQVVQKDPNKKALIEGANRSQFLTYSQLREQSHAVAQFLHNHGLTRKTAATVLPNCLEFTPFFIGVFMEGSTVSGASALFTEYELNRQLNDCGANVLFTDDDHLDKVFKATRQLPSLQLIIVKTTKTVLPPGMVSWNEVISTRVDSSRPKVRINVDEDVAILPYSSGTTGVPKGVMLTHKNFGTMLRMFVRVREVNEKEGRFPGWDTSRENLLLFLPTYHIYGFAVICLCILAESTGILLSHFEPQVFLSCIQDFKIKQLNIVPPILVFLAKHPLCLQYDLSSLRRVSSGAAPAGKDICDELLKRYPNIEFVEQGYGMTELTTGACLADNQSRTKFGSCGKVAPGLEMKIVDPETGIEVKDGEAGEICVRGPTVMKGYLGRDEATRECVRGGWMHTGDIGYIDSDGDVFIVDRFKELIKVKGLQVPPAELEDILLSHPHVADAAVIGVPNDAAGELPKAFIMKKDESLTAEEIFDYVKERVAHYKQLKGGIEFIDHIPKSPSGKILRRILREKIVSKL